MEQGDGSESSSSPASLIERLFLELYSKAESYWPDKPGEHKQNSTLGAGSSRSGCLPPEETSPAERKSSLSFGDRTKLSKAFYRPLARQQLENKPLFDAEGGCIGITKPRELCSGPGKNNPGNRLSLWHQWSLLLVNVENCGKRSSQSLPRTRQSAQRVYIYVHSNIGEMFVVGSPRDQLCPAFQTRHSHGKVPFISVSVALVYLRIPVTQLQTRRFGPRDID